MDQLNAQAAKSALLSVRDIMKKCHLDMLKAHYQATDHTLTATQLADAAGFSSYSSANLHYGELGKALADHLPIQPETRRDGTKIWTSIIALGESGHIDGEHYKWTLRPELVQALKALPWGMDK